MFTKSMVPVKIVALPTADYDNYTVEKSADQKTMAATEEGLRVLTWQEWTQLVAKPWYQEGYNAVVKEFGITLIASEHGDFQTVGTYEESSLLEGLKQHLKMAQLHVEFFTASTDGSKYADGTTAMIVSDQPIDDLRGVYKLWFLLESVKTLEIEDQFVEYETYDGTFKLEVPIFDELVA